MLTLNTENATEWRKKNPERAMLQFPDFVDPWTADMDWLEHTFFPFHGIAVQPVKGTKRKRRHHLVRGYYENFLKYELLHHWERLVFRKLDDQLVEADLQHVRMNYHAKDVIERVMWLHTHMGTYAASLAALKAQRKQK